MSAYLSLFEIYNYADVCHLFETPLSVIFPSSVALICWLFLVVVLVEFLGGGLVSCLFCWWWLGGVVVFFLVVVGWFGGGCCCFVLVGWVGVFSCVCLFFTCLECVILINRTLERIQKIQ